MVKKKKIFDEKAIERSFNCGWDAGVMNERRKLGDYTDMIRWNKKGYWAEMSIAFGLGLIFGIIGMIIWFAKTLSNY